MAEDSVEAERLEMLDERGEGDEDELGQVERISSYGEEEASFRVGSQSERAERQRTITAMGICRFFFLVVRRSENDLGCVILSSMLGRLCAALRGVKLADDGRRLRQRGALLDRLDARLKVGHTGTGRGRSTLSPSFPRRKVRAARVTYAACPARYLTIAVVLLLRSCWTRSSLGCRCSKRVSSSARMKPSSNSASRILYQHAESRHSDYNGGDAPSYTTAPVLGATERRPILTLASALGPIASSTMHTKVAVDPGTAKGSLSSSSTYVAEVYRAETARVKGAERFADAFLSLKRASC